MEHPNNTGEATMTLRQFLQTHFGWDIYEWSDHEIRF